MGLPKNTVQPDHHYTYPSERPYYDESKSTLAQGQVIDPAKSGYDYGIKDPQMTKPVVAPTTTNGTTTP